MNIKSLPKKFEMEGKPLPYFYTDKWITNGRFAIKREMVKDSHRYCLNLSGYEQLEIERLVPQAQGKVRISRTDRLYDKGYVYARVFVDEDELEYLICEDFVKHFDLHILYTDERIGICMNEDISFFVLPMRV